MLKAGRFAKYTIVVCNFNLKFNRSSHSGPFNNYVDRKGWVGIQSNVYAYKINDYFLFTSFVFEGWVGGQKCPKFCYVVIEWTPSDSLCHTERFIIHFRTQLTLLDPTYILSAWDPRGGPFCHTLLLSLDSKGFLIIVFKYV